ncbi:hypothetical protein G6L20_27200 [Agrobacterium rhizogenes]|nr:hypothetical protein [Rhizobium rhizogenes]
MWQAKTGFLVSARIRARRPDVKQTRNAGSGDPEQLLNGLLGVRRYLGKQGRIYLWASCLGCNAMFCTIGAGARQFIIFNILCLLAFGAKTFEIIPLETGNGSALPYNRSPTGKDWRPVLTFSAQLLVACYAMTVLVDNLASSPVLLGSIH